MKNPDTEESRVSRVGGRLWVATLRAATIRTFLFGTLLAGILFPTAAEAQNKNDTPIELVHADQVSLERRLGGNVYLAHGSVHFRQGPSELWADSAIYFEATRQIRLFGNVKVEDTLEVLRADTVYYEDQTDLARAYGHVNYHRNKGDLTAKARSGEYRRSDRLARLFDDAEMVIRADDPAARMEATADTLVFYSASDSGAAYGHVTVRQKDGTATAGRAHFQTSENFDRLLLTDEPQGTFKSSDVSGDTLELRIVARELENLDARGTARAVFRETSPGGGRTTESALDAHHMKMFFAGGALSDLIAVGEARSQYIPAWGKPGEQNDASGDTVKITFVDSAVSRVQVVGGAQGTYYTPRLEGSEVRFDTINYASDYIDYHVDSAWIRLWDHADITYGTVNLTAGQVVYQTEKAVLRAYGKEDTLLPPPVDYHPGERVDTTTQTNRVVDSLREALGKPKTKTAAVPAVDHNQMPVLRDGSQEVDGERLVYEIKTRRGRIIQSATHTEDGYYTGGDFRKEDNDVFYVEDGHYTTCELAEPHFEFVGSRMKIKKNDRVVTRPVVLKIEGIPVLWVPYYVFSIRKERHSGMLPLRFGNFNRGSRFVRNLGYYFAVSDYFDFTPSLDIIEGDGLLWHWSSSYALRYRLTGNFSGSYGRHTRVTSTGESLSERWNFQFNHTQQMGRSATLSGSGNFVSDNSFYQDFTSNQQDRLNRTLRSQINLSKRWHNASAVVALDDSRNLDNDSRQATLPRVTFSVPQRQIFVPRKLKGGKTEEARWYHNFRIGYSNSGQNFQSRFRRFTFDGSGNVTDTVLAEKHFATLDHRANLSFQTKLANAINLTPRMDLQETWYYIFEPTGDTLPTGVASGTGYRRLSGSAGISAQTNLYGVFPVERGALIGFRHVFTPAIGFSYSPAVVTNDAVRGYTFAGGGSSRQNASMSISLSNLFQMKTKSGDKEKRWELLNVSTSTGYNFEALTRKLSDIRTSIRSGVTRNPDISLDLLHDPDDPVTGELDFTPRLKNISASLRFNLRGGGSAGQSVGYQAEGGGIQNTGLGAADPQTTPTGRRGWSMSASYRFAESRSFLADGSSIKTITHWLGPSFQIDPSPLWHVQTNFNYNIKTAEMNDWTIRIHRDLHCWEADFSWVPAGPRSGYYFRINVKALPDVKFEKSESGLRDALF